MPKSNRQRKELLILALVLMINLTSIVGLDIKQERNDMFKPLGFGSSKVHQIFQIGNREPISYSIGYGYWMVDSSRQRFSSEKSQSIFSSFRYKYENTGQGLYINMIGTDGEKVIKQEVVDDRFKVQSDIEYMYSSNQKSSEQGQFECQVTFSEFDSSDQQTDEKKRAFFSNFSNEGYFKDSDLMWFTSVAIENSDLRLINHQDYLSPVSLTLNKTSETQVTVNVEQLTKQKDGNFDFEVKKALNFRVSQQEEIKMFGFTLNVTESYNYHNYLQEIQHLIELAEFPERNLERKNDTKMVQWENKQIEALKSGKFESKYTYVLLYGRVSRSRLRESVQYSERPHVFWTSAPDISEFQKAQFQKSIENNRRHVLQKIGAVGLEADSQEFITHTVSNLLGGLTYYEGKLYTQNSLMIHQHDYSYSFTPSRLVFPRAFLWDDGFHMAVTALIAPDITLKVLHSWLKKIDLFGWVGRQQIRGLQMGSMMPDSRFVYQDVFELNPPTFILPITKLIAHSRENDEIGGKLPRLLQRHFLAMEKNFRYFLKTQSHYDLNYDEEVQNSIKYRWRCKDECAKGNFMGSGLDDYPRVQAQTKQISKEHIDLSSWLYFYSDGLQQISRYLNQTKQQAFYEKWKVELREKVIEECLDKDSLLFKDLAVRDSRTFIDQKVNKVGYINLFPFFVGLLQPRVSDTPQRKALLLKVLEKTIEVMMDEEQLMSEGGIRSLSLNDSQYASEENYWRGAVWMPINFMIVRACKVYYWDLESDRHRELVRSLYAQLRQRLITTVKRNYEQKGYLFENYIEGQGNRGYPFYGWTSLVASIITEDY